jgi:hypothetical protein
MCSPRFFSFALPPLALPPQLCLPCAALTGFNLALSCSVLSRIGKWVFGRITQIEGSSSQVQKAINLGWNCVKCHAFSHVSLTYCRVCKQADEDDVSAVFVAAGDAADDNVSDAIVEVPGLDAVGQNVSTDAAGPTVVGAHIGTALLAQQQSVEDGEQGDKVRCHVTFYGWPSQFDEWVSLERCRPGGTALQCWLHEGATVILAQDGLGGRMASQTTHMLMMATVLRVKTHPVQVLMVKLKVDPLIPFSFAKPRGRARPTPTHEELTGVWVPLTDGRILESGSFCDA